MHVLEPIPRYNQRILLIQSPRFTHYYRCWVYLQAAHPRSGKLRNWIYINLDLPMLIPPIRSDPSRIRSTSPTAYVLIQFLTQSPGFITPLVHSHATKNRVIYYSSEESNSHVARPAKL